MASAHVGIVLATYEKNEVYAANLLYFLEHGLLCRPVLTSHKDLHCAVVVNGSLTTQTESQMLVGIARAKDAGIDVLLLRRENTGFDFAAYNAGIEALLSREDAASRLAFVICVNASTRGPFLTPCCTDLGLRWVDLFLARLRAHELGHEPQLKLIGPTINVLKRPTGVRPHVQSYAFAITRDALDHVRGEGIFNKQYDSLHDVIENQELGLSACVLAAGWNIGSLAREYVGIDFRPTHPQHGALAGFNAAADVYAGDIVYPGGRCFGRDCYPFELLFVKTNRGLSASDIHVLSMPLSRDVPR
jgi:hypothetical protein